MRDDRTLQTAQAALDEANLKSIPSLRACIVALANGYPMPPEHVAVLVNYETDVSRQKNFQATARGEKPTEVAPAWTKPAPAKEIIP